MSVKLKYFESGSYLAQVFVFFTLRAVESKAGILMFDNTDSIAGAVEPNAQGCTFAHPLFEPQVKKMTVLRTHFLGLKVVLRTQF